MSESYVMKNPQAHDPSKSSQGTDHKQEDDVDNMGPTTGMLGPRLSAHCLILPSPPATQGIHDLHFIDEGAEAWSLSCLMTQHRGPSPGTQAAFAFLFQLKCIS